MIDDIPNFPKVGIPILQKYARYFPGDSIPKLRARLWNDWHLNPTDIKQCTEHYLLYWCGKYLRTQIADGTLMHNNVRYIINWQDFPSRCYKSEQVVLSFRRCIWLPQTAYVIIRLANIGEQQP